MGSFAFGGAFVLDGPPNGVVALDLNADGKADAAFSIGTADACEVLLGTGAGNFQTPRPFAVIGPARAILAADFNGDGRAELVVATGTVNKISCLRNQSALPSIVTPPASQAVCQGSTANFSVVATNALSYQWRKNGAPLANGGNISGALTANLTITNVGVSDAAAYDVLVSNAAGTVTSSAGVLTVNAIPNITGQPASQNVCAGTLVSFTVGATGATGFQWRKNAVNIPGANASTYTINSPVVGDTGTYDCLVSNACGSATSNGASLVVVSGVPVFTTNPSSQAVCVGGTASFTVAAAGATAFQWRKNGSNIGGATSTTLLLGPVGLGDAASYDCVASNVCGNVASATATLTVFSGVPGITINPTPQFACVGGTAAFSVAASNAVAFQWRKNTINIPGATGSTLSDLAGRRERPGDLRLRRQQSVRLDHERGRASHGFQWESRDHDSAVADGGVRRRVGELQRRRDRSPNLPMAERWGPDRRRHGQLAHHQSGLGGERRQL